ncbi:hypothetical protein ATANTOWER_030828, partial [Ataeniobius toweri]|nr:hypothetical protein [Ataeniobius toweri]
ERELTKWMLDHNSNRLNGLADSKLVLGTHSECVLHVFVPPSSAGSDQDSVQDSEEIPETSTGPVGGLGLPTMPTVTVKVITPAAFSRIRSALP